MGVGFDSWFLAQSAAKFLLPCSETASASKERILGGEGFFLGGGCCATMLSWVGLGALGGRGLQSMRVGIVC